MFVNYNLQSLSDDALAERIAEVNKKLMMIPYGNDMTYSSLYQLLEALQNESMLRHEARFTKQIINQYKEVNTNVADKPKQSQTKKPKQKPGTGLSRPSFSRSSSPSQDQI